jgi:DNA-binding NarL/FixJ family response regulator
VKILIVDPDLAFTRDFRRLADESGWQFAGEAPALFEASRIASEEAPDLVAIEASLFLQSKNTASWSTGPSCLVFVGSTAAESALERILTESPPGVVSKEDSPETWRQAVEVVTRGERFLSPAALEGVLEPYLAGRAPRSDATSTPALTKRECEVISLLAEGGRNRELASALGISVKTVEHHRASAMRKLGVRGVSGLVREAIRLGLVQP